jgi:hypothetical protein
MIDEGPRPRASSDTGHALTVALVKPGRGSRRYHSMNSLSAMLYTRRVIGEETWQISVHCKQPLADLWMEVGNPKIAGET